MNNSSPSSIHALVEQAARTGFIDASYNSTLAFRPRFVSNDWSQGTKVLSTLEAELVRCQSFTFSVAFITDSGITPLLQTFKDLESQGIRGKILTTDYLSFSSPSALRKLDSLSNIEVRLFLSDQPGELNVGFHTKGYLFEYADGSEKALVGSSNLTSNALTRNKEWNLCISGFAEGETFSQIKAEFSTLWDRAQPLGSVIDAYEALYQEKQQVLRSQRVISFSQAKLQPNTMQLEFIGGLRKILDAGGHRALLISATGTGKTYASAFALRHMKANRVLFLAHREQLLTSSIRSYKNVFGTTKTFGVLSGNAKDTDADFLFATMQTMAQNASLRAFNPHAFDVIVIDEVHRAGADSYQRILNYFKPCFYLGMTASPDRPDGFDIYRLFDNNIAYEIRLQDALEEDLLCPFHYFGITELTVNGELLSDDFSDFSYLASDERVDRILEKSSYYGFSGNRIKGLIFCRTNKEASALAGKLRKRGVSALALSGGDSQKKREDAVNRLSADPGDCSFDDKLDFILTVDIFNEGVDIPSVNQIIMLRPTESSIVFIQQLGRGLRKTVDKEYVVVLDFIGNYANNYLIPLALSGDRTYNKDTIRKYVMEGSRAIPGSSTVHFDRIARDAILRSIDGSSITLRLLKEKYLNLKNKLGRTPRLVDFLNHSEIDPLLIAEKCESYQRFLIKYDPDNDLQLNERELVILRYISSYLMKGIHPHELVVLKQLIEQGYASKESVSRELISYEVVSLSDKAFDSAKHMLDLTFAASQNTTAKYGELELIDLDDKEVIVSSVEFSAALKNRSFYEAALDLAEFGLLRYNQHYRSGRGSLALYEKYTRRDVCQVLEWAHDDSSTLYGYRIKHGTCPIFVTYKKSDDIAKSTQYEDRFIDQSTFSWMTRSNVTLESKEARTIREADSLGIDIHLFVKKHDSEGSDFYYLGKAHPYSWSQTTQENDHGKQLPIVNFGLRLEHPVRDDLYDYLVE